MPELPEVETVRRGLVPALEGKTFERVVQRRADLRFPFPDRFVARLEGRTITGLGRRSKYLLAHLDSGETLIMHLGMTGRFTIAERQLGAFAHAAGDEAKHDHVVFATTCGTTVTYNDARRFGFMDLASTADLSAHPLIRDIGIEPLGNELSAAFIASAARGRKADLKAFLMDQRIVCGLGNIYVCETLFRAGLSPFKPAGRIASATGRPRAGAETLPTLIRNVLQEALDAGGSTLRDYQKTDGTLGYFQHRFAVYGREGETCIKPDCGATIERRVQSSRSTFYCPNCQRG